MPSLEGPLQFTLRGLLILQAVCAVFLSLLVTTGIVAVLIAFVATIILMVVPVRDERRRLKRFCVDFMAGVILPGLCLAFDPGILAFNKFGIFAYLAIGFQIAVLIAWLIVGPVRPWFSGIAAGVLSIGTLIAGGFGLAMLPLTLVGTLAMGIGLLGLTPFLTAYVFSRNVASASKSATRSGEGPWMVVLGVLIAIAVPVFIYMTCGETLATLLRRLLPMEHFSVPFGD
jgi:hypothetical protein